MKCTVVFELHLRAYMHAYIQNRGVCQTISPFERAKVLTFDIILPLPDWSTNEMTMGSDHPKGRQAIFQEKTTYLTIQLKSDIS